MNRPGMNYIGEEWYQLKNWLEEELTDSMKRLSNLQCTEAETQQLRGRVSLLNQMLDFPNIAAALKPRT